MASGAMTAASSENSSGAVKLECSAGLEQQVSVLTARARMRAFRVTLYSREEVYAATRVEEDGLRRDEEAWAAIEPFGGGNSSPVA